jgi:protein-S-isoprenylcysteine O-methyltransferase Ste14
MARLATFIVLVAAGLLYTRRHVDPTLFKERLKPAGPTQDPAAMVAIRLAAFASVCVLVADRRWLHWSDTVPLAAEWLGLLVFALAGALVVRSITANRFFSSAVRIQTDRGHQLVTTGPYAYVRHPGYLGMIMIVPAVTLTGGSWIASAIALVYSALIVRRAAIEDRFLQQNLDGYRDYAARVGYRLVPGVW